MPTLIVSIFGVTFYQLVCKKNALFGRKEPAGKKGARELLNDLKAQAFKNGRVPPKAQKDFAEIESMLLNFEQTANHLKQR